MTDLDRLASDIASSGVDRVFGIPGSGPSYTLLAALESLGVEYVLTHFEGSAALMAGAQGRLSGRAGVAISIKGPGLANMVPGLAACRLEAFPLVSISEAYLPDTPVTSAHKRMDHNGLTCATAKGMRFLSHEGPGFPELASWAQSEVPGPVHLNIAGSGIDYDTPIPTQGDHENDDGLPGRVMDLIAKAERPVVIAGTLAIRSGWMESLNNLSVPVFSTAAAKGVVNENAPHSAGVYTGVGLHRVPESTLFPQADLVIGLGLRLNEVLAARKFHCGSILVDPVPEHHQFGYEFNYTVSGSAREVGELFGSLQKKTWGLEELNGTKTELRNHMLGCGFLPAVVLDIIESHFQGRMRLVLDTGYFCTIGEHVCRISQPDWYLASGQGRYMGIGLPLSIGGALYDGTVPTVAVLGDGSIGMSVADLKLAVQYRLPLLIVLMRDGYFGSIRVRSIKDGLTARPVTIFEPSWIKPVEGLGVTAERVESGDQLVSALAGWKPSEGPLFIEAMFDANEYQSMVEGIRG